MAEKNNPTLYNYRWKAGRLEEFALRDGTIASASYALTASYASQVESASYALTASYASQVESASYALTASYAVSASYEIIKEVSSSYADTASYINPLNQDVFINGDLTITGSFIVSGSGLEFTGPLTASIISSSGLITSVSGTFDYLQVNGNSYFNGGIRFKTTRVTSSTYTIQPDDYRIGVKYTLTGSVLIQLPQISNIGELDLKFKDEEGNADLNNITIRTAGIDLIDGSTTIILDRNYIAIGLYNDGISNWYIE